MAETLAPEGLTEEETVKLVTSLVRPGELALQTRIEKLYDPAYETYRAQPSKKAGQLPAWRSQIRVPYAQQNIDTALVNIVAGVPRCVVTPRHPDDVLAAQAMQACLDYYVQDDHLVEKQPLFAQQGLVMGVTIAKVPWGYKERAVKERVWLPDGEDGRLRPTVRVNPEAVVQDGPCFIPWSVYDCYWDPNGRDVDSCRYIVLDEWMSKDEVVRRARSERNPAGWRNVPLLLETAAKRTRSDSYQDQYLGQLNRHKGEFKISEVITDEAVFTLGNDTVLLEQKANPYWHGQKNVVIAQTRPDLFEMQGIPEVDLLRDIQSALHTLQNMTIDSVHLSVMRFATYREGGVADPNMIVIRPQGKIPVTDHDDIQFPVVPPVAGDVFTERERLLSDMERVTGVNQYLTGSDAQTSGDTATSVTTYSAAAGQLMRFKAGIIHYKGFQRMFEMWGSMIQQFQTREIWAEIAGPEGGEAAWDKIEPHRVQTVADLHYRLVGSEENLSRQTARNEASTLLTALFPYVQAGIVDPTAIIIALGQAYEVPDPQKLLKPPAPPMPPAMPGMPPQNGAPSGLPPTLPNGMSMPPLVQGAITQQ